ncbi:hypothetical protein AYR56_05275 [Loigolactobacillus backii]|uniref:Uncharacterized protein n=1 Tax=Loigolactobacillus backii TaxID=375175 RepID=A0A192H567_9LACO|nr:hypothetical protein [Loigolactobacillus backii]ANK63383.1 hypothetical protein AYR53_11730 [Loigolactobacillus backii]ANK69612.1 hypothetical protein AYR56_05275 [Loigolactobacillus backii]
MENKEFAIELDVNDMEANIYMRMTRDELNELEKGIQKIIEAPKDLEDHGFYRQSTIDGYDNDKVTITVGLHKWRQANDEIIRGD